MDEVAEMSLCTSYFPVAALLCAVLPHKPRWRHQNVKIKTKNPPTNSNKASDNVFTANYPQKVSKCSHSPSVFSHKIDSQYVSQAVLWEASDVRINAGAVGVMSAEASSSSSVRGYSRHNTLEPGVEKTTYSLSQAEGPQHSLHSVHLYNPNGN